MSKCCRVCLGEPFSIGNLHIVADSPSENGRVVEDVKEEDDEEKDEDGQRIGAFHG